MATTVIIASTKRDPLALWVPKPPLRHRTQDGALGYSRWRDRSLHLCFKTVRATFAAHGSSVMRPLLQVSVWLSQTAQTTWDLTFRASPLRGIAPSRLYAGSSAFLALLLLITYTSPSSRQRILGITPGLGFLRNPSPYAMRLAPAPVVSRRGRTRSSRAQARATVGGE